MKNNKIKECVNCGGGVKYRFLSDERDLFYCETCAKEEALEALVAWGKAEEFLEESEDE